MSLGLSLRLSIRQRLGLSLHLGSMGSLDLRIVVRLLLLLLLLLLLHRLLNHHHMLMLLLLLLLGSHHLHLLLLSSSLGSCSLLSLHSLGRQGGALGHAGRKGE